MTTKTNQLETLLLEHGQLTTNQLVKLSIGLTRDEFGIQFADLLRSGRIQIVGIQHEPFSRQHVWELSNAPGRHGARRSGSSPDAKDQDGP